jgi:hypothetical protein
MKTRPVAMSALLSALALLSPASAAVISTYDHNGDGFVSGSGADTYLSEQVDSPAVRLTNYGNASPLLLRNDGNIQGQPYIRFDLSAIDKASAWRARLQLYDFRFDFSSGWLRGNTFSLWALNDGPLDNWVEGNGGSDNSPAGEITWASAPGHVDDQVLNGPDLHPAQATLLSTFTYTQQGATAWNVPLQISGLLERVKNDTNNQLTLMITSPSGSSTSFRVGSKETSQQSLVDKSPPILVGSAAPRLLVDTSTAIVSTFDHDGDGVASGTGADSWIGESSKTSNYGAAGDLRFRNNPTGQQELAYLRFDLSAIYKAGAVDAQLQVYDFRFDEGKLMTGKTFSVWALTNEALDNWDENSITWNAAAGHTDDGIANDDPDLNSDATFLGTFTFSQQLSTNGWGLPVSLPGLLDLIRGDTNNQLTLMISGPVGSAPLFYIASKETVLDRRLATTPSMPAGSLAPRLLITTVPEPATAWLALAGLGLWMCRLRRSASGSKQDRG